MNVGTQAGVSDGVEAVHRGGAGTPAIVLSVLWIASVCAGMALLWRHANTPGSSGTVPAAWPTAVPLVAQRPMTLVMFSHPRCPCTRASIRELERLAARCRDALRGYVVFVAPEGCPEGWERTDSWDTAAAIPGIEARSDRDGAIARAFGAATSGHAVLYDAGGRLLFSGGITAARGHDGASEGSRSIEDLLAGRATSRADAPVFGCELFGPSPDLAGAAPSECCDQHR